MVAYAEAFDEWRQQRKTMLTSTSTAMSPLDDKAIDRIADVLNGPFQGRDFIHYCLGNYCSVCGGSEHGAGGDAGPSP